MKTNLSILLLFFILLGVTSLFLLHFSAENREVASKTNIVENREIESKINIYKELEVIKKEANPYDEEIQLSSFEQTFAHISYTRRSNKPMFVGADPKLQGFGESKYDKGITMDDLKDKSLEDIRKERRNEEITSITKAVIINLLIASCIIGFIFYLIKSSKK